MDLFLWKYYLMEIQHNWNVYMMGFLDLKLFGYLTVELSNQIRYNNYYEDNEVSLCNMVTLDFFSILFCLKELMDSI